MSTLFVVADIGGPEGFHLGDEAMLEANLDALRRWYPDQRFVTSSRDPLFTEKRYAVRAIPWPSLSTAALPELDWDSDQGVRERSDWLLNEATVDAVRRVDGLIVSGGGNLCATWPEKLLERAALLHCAADQGKPAIVVGQTLGPELTPRQSALLGAALGRARLIGVRERSSFELARSLGLQNACMQVDDAFFLEPRPKGGEAARWLAAGRRFILVSLDPSLGSTPNAQRLERIAGQLDALATAIDADLVFVPHVGGWEAAEHLTDDRAIGRRLAELLDAPLRHVESWEPKEILWLTAQAALVVSTRYHGIVFATAAGVPSLGIHSDRYTRAKLRGALAHADLAGWAIDLGSASRGDLLTAGVELWHRRGDVCRRLVALREKAAVQEQARWERIIEALGLASDRASVRPLEFRLPSVAFSALESGAEAGPPKNVLSEEQWQEYAQQGYVRLGRLLDEPELAALRTRIDAIMLGQIRFPSLATQLDTGGAYEALPEAIVGLAKPTLAYRKVQGLEGDPLFLSVLRFDVFREICRWHYGPHAATSLFRAMVMNKPAGLGTHLPWHQDGGEIWKLDRDPLVTIWVALDRATREKGCLQVIPGSHRLGLLSRDGSTLSSEDVRRHCPEEAIVHLEIEAGEALLLHNWVIHRSGVNVTDSPRRAFTACYMDARTVSTLTGERFPVLFGEHDDTGETLSLVARLKDEMRLLRATAEESVRYAMSLQQEMETLRSMREEAERYAWSLEAELRRIQKDPSTPD